MSAHALSEPQPELSPREQLTTWILRTPEAARVRETVPSQDDILEFCDRDPELLEQMAANRVSPQQVARELFRSEWLKATLSEVSSAVSAPTLQELRRYYDRYPGRWVTPERRQVSHILITVQDQFPENHEVAAKSRIEEIARRVREGEDFAALATRHSECPTSLSGGDLGWVVRGTVFPELETTTFAMAEGEVSQPVRSQMGWHLLFCKGIEPEGYRTFQEVMEPLSNALLERRRREAQKRWVHKVAQEKRDAN